MARWMKNAAASRTSCAGCAQRDLPHTSAIPAFCDSTISIRNNVATQAIQRNGGTKGASRESMASLAATNPRTCLDMFVAFAIQYFFGYQIIVLSRIFHAYNLQMVEH